MMWLLPEDMNMLPSAAAGYFALHATNRQWRAMLRYYLADGTSTAKARNARVARAMRQRERWRKAVAKARKAVAHGA